MKPVNSKSWFATLCNTMEKIDRNEIDIATANTIGMLSGKALGYLNHEVFRASKMADPKIKAEFRNIEMKDFDYLPE